MNEEVYDVENAEIAASSTHQITAGTKLKVVEELKDDLKKLNIEEDITDSTTTNNGAGGPDLRRYKLDPVDLNLPSNSFLETAQGESTIDEIDGELVRVV